MLTGVTDAILDDVAVVNVAQAVSRANRVMEQRAEAEEEIELEEISELADEPRLALWFILNFFVTEGLALFLVWLIFFAEGC